MDLVLSAMYVLSVFVVVGVVIASLVAIRRSEVGYGLELEMVADGSLDRLADRQPSARESVATAA